MSQLVEPRIRAPYGHEQLTFGRKLQDLQPAAIRDIDVPLGIDCDAFGPAPAASYYRKDSPFIDPSSLRGNLYNAEMTFMVAIGDIGVIGGVEDDVVGAVKTQSACAIIRLHH